MTAVKEGAQTLQNAHRRQHTHPPSPHCQLVQLGGRGGLTALLNAPRCWRVKALTQIHMGAQKPVRHLPALEYRNQTVNIKADHPPQSHWMTPAQDPGTTPDHRPPTAKHQWQVMEAAERRTCKSKLQMQMVFLFALQAQSRPSSI